MSSSVRPTSRCRSRPTFPMESAFVSQPRTPGWPASSSALSQKPQLTSEVCDDQSSSWKLPASSRLYQMTRPSRSHRSTLTRSRRRLRNRKKIPTESPGLGGRNRTGYNGRYGRGSVGFVGTGPLVRPATDQTPRRSFNMSRPQLDPVPPRAERYNEAGRRSGSI
jgi:hypothetical protein